MHVTHHGGCCCCHGEVRSGGGVHFAARNVADPTLLERMRRERRLRGERVTMDGWMEEGRNIRLYEAHKRQKNEVSKPFLELVESVYELSSASHSLHPVKGCSDCVMWSKSSGKGGYSKRVRGPLVRTIKRGRCERCRDHVIFSLSLSHTRTHRPGSLHPGLSLLYQRSH